MAKIMEFPIGDRDAAKIGVLYDRARRSLIANVQYLIEAVDLLMAKKASLHHGEWLPWLEANADDRGFSSNTARRLLAVAKLSAGRTICNDTEAAEIIKYLWGHTGPVRGTAGTGENEWFTPGIYLERARAVLGEIDLDPASHELAQRIVRAKQYFTKADDGLSRPWHGRLWLNPPYAQPLIAQFVQKLLDEHLAGRVMAAILLTHNYTDTAWFQLMARDAKGICFTRGRVRFYEPDGEEAAPTQGQAFSYFGADRARFIENFSDVGFVMVKP